MERIALALHGRDQGVDRGVKRVSKRESMSLQELRFYALLPGPDQRHGSRLSSSPGSRGVRRGRNGGSLGMGGRRDRRHPAGGDPVLGGGGGDSEAAGKTAEALLGPKACWIEHWWTKMGT